MTKRSFRFKLFGSLSSILMFSTQLVFASQNFASPNLVSKSNINSNGARSEVAIILGGFNEKMDFARKVVKSVSTIEKNFGLIDYTTGAIYYSYKNGASSIHIVKVAQDNGQISGVTAVIAAIDSAAHHSKVVVFPFGGSQMEQICNHMSLYSETVFLLVSGVLAGHPSPSESNCNSSNILIVAGLNSQLEDVSPRENTGSYVRLAAPSMNFKAPVDENRFYTYNNRTFGLSIVAGKMSSVLREKPSLSGSTLIDDFLENATQVLPKLVGKVKGARAVTRFEN